MKNKPYRYLLYLGLRILQPIVLFLPRKFSFQIGKVLARLAFFFILKEREKTIRHLTLAYAGEKTTQEIYGLAYRVFLHWGEAVVEALRVPRLNRDKVDRLVETGDGLAKIERILDEGKGMILLTAHLGNWELLAALVRLHGHPGTVVGKEIYYEKYNQEILRLRGHITLRTIYQDASPRELLEVLRKKEILGILPDQDIDSLEGIFVPFFGRPAYTVTSPVKLALVSGAPIVPVFLVRHGPHYRLLVEEPIRVEKKEDREDTIREYTERWSRVIEDKIRTYPEQWVWMHRRWKTAPPPEAAQATLSGAQSHD